VGQKNLQKNQMLPHNVLPRGSNLDTAGTSLSLSPQISQRKNQKSRKLKASGWTMQYPQPPSIVYSRDHPTTRGLQKRMRFLSVARETH
jgi:hypothetical protein